MIFVSWKGKPALALLATLAAACGGGSGGGDGGGGGGGGGQTAATVRGVVAGGGQRIEVGGIPYSTAGAILRVDDSPAETLPDDGAGRARLRDGMVVTVRGRHDGASGTATEIEYHPVLEDFLDSRGATWVSLHGHDLSADDSTRAYDRTGAPKALSDLARGTRVEVSGVPDGRGGLRVTMVREKDAISADAFEELRGYVLSISGTILTLSLTPGGPVFETVELGQVTAPVPSLAPGDAVEVKAVGNRDASFRLVASVVQKESELEGERGGEMEVEGFVASGTLAEFVVAGQRVRTDSSTQLRGGVAADFTVGMKAEAEGIVQADGSLLAREVRLGESARADARVEAATVPTDAPPGFAQLTLLGRSVSITRSTEVLGGLDPAAVAAGLCVQVRGYAAANGTDLVATRLEPSAECADRALLRGVVTARSPTASLTILGIAVNTAAASFKDGTAGTDVDFPGGAAAFFAAVTPGQSVVKVRWRPYPTGAPGATPVEEAELEAR